jgi:putative MATE family efflux protein
MVPILIQNLITNFVSLLDNIMVGQVGTEPMSGVAIVNQLFFVFCLCIFGGQAGPGIFTAQFFGKGDNEGVRHTMRVKLYVALGAVLVFGVVLLRFGDKLIGLFLHEGEEGLDLAATLGYGKSYLNVMLWQMIPFAACQLYASTLREAGETVLPMKAGIIAVFVNLCFNYILIFGKFGFPALGVVGAAIATVIARIVECAIVISWPYRHPERCPYVKGAFRSLAVPGALFRQIAVMGFPLLINELLWSGGMTMLNQCYSLRGLEVVSAFNISSTISNLFFCAFLAMGNAIAIIVGQQLGAGELEKARDDDRKLIAFSVALSVVVGALMALVAPLLPRMYNTTEGVRQLAVSLLLIGAALMPMHAFANACYFTLRSGGKTIITFIFDSLFTWLLSIPAAFVLSRYTSLPILPMYTAVEALNIFKCILGFMLVRSGKWVVNLVGTN